MLTRSLMSLFPPSVRALGVGLGVAVAVSAPAAAQNARLLARFNTPTNPQSTITPTYTAMNSEILIGYGRTLTRVGPTGPLEKPAVPVTTNGYFNAIVRAGDRALVLTTEYYGSTLAYSWSPGTNEVTQIPQTWPGNQGNGIVLRGAGNKVWLALGGFSTSEVWRIDPFTGVSERRATLKSPLGQLAALGPDRSLVGISSSFFGISLVTDADPIQLLARTASPVQSLGASVRSEVGDFFFADYGLYRIDEQNLNRPVLLGPWFPQLLGTSIPRTLAPIPGGVVFSGFDSALWFSDGTPAGTRNIKPRVSTPGVQYVTAFRNGALFIDDSAEIGRELWFTDGTSAGTRLVADIVPGPTGSDPIWLTVIGDYGYFFATTPDAGTEPWRTDGTAAGTRRLADIVPGAGGSAPRISEYTTTSLSPPIRSDPVFVRIGPQLAVFAFTPDLGTQLWALDEPPACPADYNRDQVVNLDDLGDFVTDFYTQPPIPGGRQPAAPTHASLAVGFGVPCPASGDAPAPYAPDAYRTAGFRVGFSRDGDTVCPAGPGQLFPSLDHLGDFISAYFAADGCNPPL